MSLAFASGVSLSTLLAGFAFIFYNLAENGNSSFLWLLGTLLIVWGVGGGIYIHNLFRKSAAERPDVLLAALDAAMDASVVTALDGEPIYASASYRLYSPVDGVVLSPLRLAAGDAAGEAVITALHNHALAGGKAEAEVYLPLPQGKPRCFLASVRRAVGTNHYLVWQFQDIEDKKSAEGALKAAYRVMADALNDSKMGFIATGPGGIVQEINPAMAGWLGQKAPMVVGKLSLKELVPELSVAENSRSYKQKTQIFGPAGSDNPPLEISLFSLSKAAGPSGSGHIILAQNSVQEVRNIERVEVPHSQFEEFFNDAPVGIATVDAIGNVTKCNRIFQKLIPGYDPAGVNNLQEILPPEDLREVLERLKSALKGTSKIGAIDVHFKRDPAATGQLYIHGISGGGGEAQAILYLIDTTEQKNLEMQFAQSQKMQAVGQLAGGIAHDFNNLLTAISGFCDLLLVRHGPGDHSFEDIIQIKQNANRAANLVRQLLAFSRQQTLRPKVLMVTDVLAELSNLLRRLIGENIELSMSHGRDLGLVRVDQGQLEQVIINLAVNARDAMPDGGAVTIRTANISLEESKTLGHEIMPPNNYVLLEVSDTGTGIPSEHIGKIFEPFFSTKEVGKGTGLGLSTVYGIVKQTGGFIFPDSAPGKGATFRIYLPIHQGGEEEEVKQKATRTGPEKAKDLTGKGTILLVEDEDAVRMFASRALRNKGYVVHEAASGEAALEIVDQEEKIDLLISDVVMPQMDGPSLVKEIRRRRDGIKIIFISGYAEDAFRKNLGKGEVFTFLPKPFSLKQLAEKVKDVLLDVDELT